MLQILLFFSTLLSNIGDSVYRMVHGVFALILFTPTRQPKFTPTLATPASPLLDTPATFLEPSQVWSPQPSNELPATQGFASYRNPFTVVGSELSRAAKPLILLSLLVLLCLPFCSDFGSLVSTLFSLAQSVPSKFSAFVHADCCEKIGRADTELAKKCHALDTALRQIERDNSRIQSLTAENGSLSSLVLDQGAEIRRQSAVIARLEGQLHDHERVFLQTTRSGEQHERSARVNRQEVTRLEERITTLAAESDMAQSMFVHSLQAAEIREGQLCDALHSANTREARLRNTLRSNEALLSKVQAALRTAEDTGRAQQQALTLELEACAMQREHWKTTAEQAEMKAAASDQSILDLRKELAVALRNAREAKGQLEDQTVVIGERDATIRALNCELVEVRGQLRDAEDEIVSLRSDQEHVDAWVPLDDVDVLQFNDGTPPVLEWCGWLTKNEFKIPTPATQPRPRSPDMSIEELCSDGPTPTRVAASIPNEPLACSTTPIIRSAPLDDPFVVDSLLKPCLSPNPTFAVFSLAGSPATPVSPLGRTEVIDDLQEQLVQEQLARVDAEYALTLQQLKVLATEAVVVVQRRQFTDQQCRLSEETTKNVSLREEIRNLKVEHGVMTAKIAQSEASLAECQTARMAATKAAGDARTELAKVKEILSVLVTEADELKKEVDELRIFKTEHGAMTAQVAHLEASLEESQTATIAATKVAGDMHTELVKVKRTLSTLTKEANSLRKKGHELKKEADGLKKGRHTLDMRLSQAMLLSSALQKRVHDLEQRASKVSSTPSDGTDSEGNRSLNLVVPESVSYLLDTPLPSISSRGSIPDRSLLDSRRFPPVTATKPGLRSLTPAVPDRKKWSTFPAKLSATPPTVGRGFDGLVTSETALSLMLASTPPDALPTLSPVSASTSGSPFSSPPSPCHLTSYPRPEDCPMPIVGRVRKRRSSPPPTSQPNPPKGKVTRR
ncbi:hypothetical protein EDB87DRAFT_1181449 [Lactarius vividus]|nr:hypothetical protein EDB87DRAFT_1181449 [Lactarius vividus]